MNIRFTLFASKSHLSLFLFTLLLIGVAPARAQQQTAVLEGTVIDKEGAPLPGANVSVPALERGASVDEDGMYRITGLPASQQLTVRFSFVGYVTEARQVTLERGETRTLDVTLQPQALEASEVVVTGTPTAQSTLKATQQVDAIAARDLEANRTAALGDLIEESVPGAASVKTGAQAGKPVLRGLTGNRVKVLVGGVAQEYYQFGVRHFPNTSLGEAERIEVVRGPASLLYGSDALGGAINIIPKPLPDAGLGGRASGQYFGNNNERAALLDLRGGSETFGARAGIERRVAGNFTTPDAPTFFETKEGGTFGDPKYTGEVPFTNFEQWSGYGQVGARGDWGRVQILGDYWRNRHNFVLPPGGPNDDNPDNKPVMGLGQNLEHANIALKGNLRAGSFAVKPRLSFQRAIRQSAGKGNSISVVDEADSGFDWPVDLAKNVYTGRVDVLHPAFRNFSGRFGVEAVYHDGQSSGKTPLEPSAQVMSLGTFVFEEYDPAGPLTFSGGARLDYHRHEADPPKKTMNALDLSPEDLDKSYTTLSGSVGANYAFADGWAAVANLGTGFRAPSIFELYGNGQHGGVAAFQQGNPVLDPERTVSADLGVRARTGRITGEIVGYYTYFTNYIYLRNTGARLNGDSGPPVYTSGQTTASIQGVEASAEVAALPWLTVGGEAAFLTSEGDDLEANAGGERILPLIPADRLGGFVRFEPEGVGRLRSPFVKLHVHHALSKDAAGRYEPFAQFDAGFGPPFGTASTQSYTLADLTTGATLAAWSAVRPTLTAGVKNLFDNAYRNFLDTYKGYALSPGRNVFVKVSVPFGAGS
jgi:iron complex outermembrane receptor protein/hemoglobin/transferrin/lactoferrin receptor protein